MRQTPTRLRSANFVRWGLIAASLAAVADGRTRAAEGEPSARQIPNIVYILADDLGYGDVSALNPGGRLIVRRFVHVPRDRAPKHARRSRQYIT